MQLASDSNISFGMLKKNRLSNFEKVFAETFKAPLEKMNTKDDLYKWSEDFFIKEVSKRTDNKGTQDKLDFWKDKICKTINNSQEGCLWKCILYNAIQRTDIYYPTFDTDIIKSTIKQISDNIENLPDRFNFMKLYEQNLRSSALDKYFPDKNNQNGWLRFSKKDGKVSDTIITDIRNLSIGTKWCTKSKLFAEECIDAGDFYILYKDGLPILGIRTHNNKIYEIKNKMNKPVYESLNNEIDELLKQHPELEKYNDSISIWDNF